MIKNLQIRNFKSIKNLDLECERINLFIGEPNTGKSNILETLGILSFSKYGSITDFVRIESMSDLFYDENLDEKITISADDTVLEITFDKERFIGRCYKKELSENVLFSFDFDYNGRGNVKYRRYRNSYQILQIFAAQGISTKGRGVSSPPVWGKFIYCAQDP